MVDEVLGAFVRDGFRLPDGTWRPYDFYSLDLRLDGRRLTLTLNAADPEQARDLLPRLRRALENRSDLHCRAAEAVVHAFSDQPPTPAELADAHDDLQLTEIEAYTDAEDALIVVHLADSCGQHFADGYWPAVGFNRQDAVTDVSVRA